MREYNTKPITYFKYYPLISEGGVFMYYTESKYMHYSITSTIQIRYNYFTNAFTTSLATYNKINVLGNQ